ncbi:MAG: hypothetical protein PHG85_02520 [Candidatus Altiarchaeota archaeon]|nr:hypothetical protein [Candidatus Altiarchaeota archaeon]
MDSSTFSWSEYFVYVEFIILIATWLLSFLTLEKLLIYLKKNKLDTYKVITWDVLGAYGFFVNFEYMKLKPISGWGYLFVDGQENDKKILYYKKLFRRMFLLGLLLLLIIAKC